MHYASDNRTEIEAIDEKQKKAKKPLRKRFPRLLATGILLPRRF
jgi:hypothetical protein